MAHLYNGPLRPGAPHSERQAFRAATQMSDDWHVLPEVQWAGVVHHRDKYSDSDLLLLHAQFGLVFLEVKGGFVSVRRGEWFTRPRNSGRDERIKHPYLQARDSMHAILDFLKREAGLGFYIPATYGVVLPGTPPNDELLQRPWDGGPVITVYPEDLADLETHLNGRLSPRRTRDPLTKEQVQQIVRAVAPSFDLKLRLPTLVRQAHQQIERYTETAISLTEEQVALARALDGAERLLVYGGAGSGKTVMAVHRALTLARETDGNVLLMCHRDEFRSHLTAMIPNRPGNLTVSTFHGLAHPRQEQAEPAPGPQATAASIRRRRGGRRRQGEARPIWETYNARELAEEVEKQISGRSFEAIVVDEAQEFPVEILDRLHRLLRDPNRGLYIFADPYQRAGHKGGALPIPWRPPFAAPRFLLTSNCRNTGEIADLLQEIRPDVPSRNPIEGPEVYITTCQPDSLGRATVKSVKDLIGDGVDPNEIVVIPVCRSPKDIRRFVVAAGLEQSGVRVRTVEAFKGREAEAVVTVFDWPPGSVSLQVSRAYVACSRARSVLCVVGTEEVITSLGVDLE